MLARDIEMFIEHCGLKGLSTKTINSIETFYSSKLDEDGMPCMVLDYSTPPKWLGY